MRFFLNPGTVEGSLPGEQIQTNVFDSADCEQENGKVSSYLKDNDVPGRFNTIVQSYY